MGNNRQKMKFQPDPELMKKILDHRQIKIFNSALARYKGMGFSFEEATKKALGDIDPNVDWRSQVSQLLKRYEDEREKKREESRGAKHDPGLRGKTFRKREWERSQGDKPSQRHLFARRASPFDIGSPAHPLHPLSGITDWIGKEIGKEWESTKAQYGNLGRDIVNVFTDPARARLSRQESRGRYDLTKELMHGWEEPERVPLTPDEKYLAENRHRMFSKDPQDRIDWLKSLSDSDIAKGYHKPDELKKKVLAAAQKRTREKRLRGMFGRADPFDVVQSPLWAFSPQDKRRYIAEQQEKHREAMESSPAFMATRGGIYPHKNYQQRYLDPRAVRDFEDIQGDKLRPEMETYIESSLAAAKKARLNAAHPPYHRGKYIPNIIMDSVTGSSGLGPIGLIDQDAMNTARRVRINPADRVQAPVWQASQKEIDYNLRRAEIMHNRANRDFEEGRYRAPLVPWHENMSPYERAQAQRGRDIMGRRQAEDWLERSREYEAEQQELPPLERDLPFDSVDRQGLKEPWMGTRSSNMKVPEYAMEYLTGVERYTPSHMGVWKLR